MKTTTLSRTLASLAVITVLSWAGAKTSFADDHHDAWSHDHDGYWDNHGHRHAYIMHEHHHGFWRDDNGARVFINID